jgi:hypothetical protein
MTNRPAAASHSATSVEPSSVSRVIRPSWYTTRLPSPRYISILPTWSSRVSVGSSIIRRTCDISESAAWSKSRPFGSLGSLGSACRASMTTSPSSRLPSGCGSNFSIARLTWWSIALRVFLPTLLYSTGVPGSSGLVRSSASIDL